MEDIYLRAAAFVVIGLGILIVLSLFAMVLSQREIMLSMRSMSNTQRDISDSLRENTRSQRDISNTQREQSNVLQSLATQVAVLDAKQGGYPNE